MAWEFFLAVSALGEYKKTHCNSPATCKEDGVVFFLFFFVPYAVLRISRFYSVIRNFSIEVTVTVTMVDKWKGKWIFMEEESEE